MNNFFRQFRLLLLAQFREFYREPEVLFWTFAFPIAMAWVLGIAFSGEREQQKNVAWVQHYTNKSVGYLFNGLEANGYKIISEQEKNVRSARFGSEEEGFTKVKFIPADYRSAEEMIKKGKATLIIVDYSDSVSYHFDHGNSDAYTTYLLLTNKLSVRNSINPSIKKLETPGLRYIDFFLPGLIAMGIMSSAMWGISFTLIERRSKKLLRRMVATPMNKNAFLLSVISGRIILSFFESLILYLFALAYFSTEVTGSIIALLLVFLAGNICFSGIAILTSSRTAKSQVGNGLINAITLPMTVCSGVFFSYHNFPEWLIPYIKILPLTILADDMRSIFIESAGLGEVLPGVVILTLLGSIITFIGAKIYKWY
ncbi:MAG: ABC transporter permease [Ignavibacteriaceae bacterium]|nr:ABC transporter permease [Ignavibacteriaceae bacterium]